MEKKDETERILAEKLLSKEILQIIILSSIKKGVLEMEKGMRQGVFWQEKKSKEMAFSE